jgi:hypothetical protein
MSRAIRILEASPNKKAAPHLAEPLATNSIPTVNTLVRALLEQCRQHAQVREREQPLVRLTSRGFGCACDKAQVPLLCEIVQMFQANARQTRDFEVGEYFLAGPNGDHVRASSALISLAATPSMLTSSYGLHSSRAIVVPFGYSKTTVLVLFDEIR